MSLPKISLDPAAPDTLYSGAQKINQAIDALDNHIQTLTGHRHTGKDGDAPPIPLEGIDAAAKTTPGGTEPNRLAMTDANGRVGDSERVGGQTLANLDARYAPASHADVLTAHLNDNMRHATQEEKDAWNTHINNKNNPHNVTKEQVGLGNVDNVKQMPISGGTFTGIATAHSNTSYTTRQIRNIILSTADPNVSAMQDGDIWIKYK